MTAEMKLLKICKQIFEIKCPIRLEGITSNVYLNVVEIKFNSRFGTAFFIFLRFNNVINVIEIKNATMMLFIPIRGVKVIKQTNSSSEPTM